MIESISIPTNDMFWHGCKIDLFIFIIRPKLCRRYMTVSRLMWASHFLWLKINISPKYIISLMLIFLWNEIGIFSNFLNTFCAGPSPKHTHLNSSRVPFHWDFKNFVEFWFSGTLKYASFRSSLHIQSPSCMKYFNWEKPYILITGR